MPNVERFGTFYPIWPILDGKPLNMQWGEIRSNQAELKALARNSFQELEEDVDELNAQRALEGQAYGDLAFSKKYRLFYNKVTEEFCCQRNTGTVNSPIWVDAWCVRFSDGQFQAVGEGGISSAAGFYGPGLQSIEEVAESGSTADVSIRNPTKIFFNADDGFGVQPIASGANAGQPEIRFTQPFGRAQAFEKSGRVWQVDHNFGVTPVMVTVFDQDDRIITPDTVDVSNPNTTWFYFNSVFSGTAYIASGGLGATTLLPRDPFYLVVRTDDQEAGSHLLKPNADLIFDSNFFYVTVDLDTDAGGAHKKAFVSMHTIGSLINHGDLLGLADDDHPQYARKAAEQNTFAGVVTAEAFYLEAGGEFSTSGDDVLIKAVDPGHVKVDDDLIVTHRVVAEGFYLQTNTGLFSGPNIYLDGEDYMRIDGNSHPVIINKSGADVVVGNPGTEGTLINIAGFNRQSSLKVSQIGQIGDDAATQDIASLHLHRHSTLHAPGIIASRAKSNTPSHSNVEDGDYLFTLYATGRLGSSYEVAARMDVLVDGTPNAGADSVPGKIVFRTSPVDTDVLGGGPERVVIHSDGHVQMNNTLNVENAVTAEAFYLKTGGELITAASVITDHGGLSGLLDDDHTQYLLVDGTRAMTGDLNMGGKDIANAAAGTFSNRVVAEAFYLEPGSGGEFSKSGNDVYIKSKDGDVIIDDSLRITGSTRVSERVVAEAFYLKGGGELSRRPTNTVFLSSPNQVRIEGTALTADIAGDITIDAADTLALVATNQINLTNTGGTINLDAEDDVNITSNAGAFQVFSDLPINFNNNKVRFFSDGSINAADKVTAEAFYLKTGGELIVGIDVSDGPTTFLDKPALVFNPTDFYLTQSSQGAPVVNLVSPTQPTQIYVYPTSMTTTSTSFADVTGFTFEVKAGGYYTFEYRLILNSTAQTEGPGLQLVTPTFSVFHAQMDVAASLTPGAVTLLTGHQTASGVGVQFSSGTTAQRLGRIFGIIVPTADGTVQLQFATETGGAQSSTLSAGSCVFVSRLL